MKAIGSKLNSEPAVTSTVRRKRMTLHNILEFAGERELMGGTHW